MARLTAICSKPQRTSRMERISSRPSYQRAETRVYGLLFAGFDIRFTVRENTLTVTEVTPRKSGDCR